MSDYQIGQACALTAKGAAYINETLRSPNPPAQTGDVCWVTENAGAMDFYVFANGSHNGGGRGWYLYADKDVTPLTSEEADNVPNR